MSKWRMTVVKILTFLLLCLLVFRLYNLQIVKGEGYKKISNSRSTATVTQKAPRGDIKDRNGVTLVTNREGYSLVWTKSSAKDEQINNMLAHLCDILAQADYQINDSLPISFYPYEYTFTDENNDGSTEDEKEKWFSGKKKLKKDMTAEEVVNVYKKLFNVDAVSADAERKIIGIRYTAEVNGFSYSVPYTLVQDVDLDIITKIKEQNVLFSDIEVTKDYFREYKFDSLAAHTLGRVGKIYKEEYDELYKKGYGMNDIVGKQGIEKICEDELRGQDGYKILNSSDGGNLLDEYNEDAVAGNYVVTTIDSELQRVAEESLERNIKKIAENGVGRGLQKGADANAGAVVITDVNSGEILALATYPTYSPITFNEDYESLSKDEAKPLWNRAISGAYSPGSTFKPLTAIAALETGAVSIDEKLICNGVYKYFDDYQPKCWIYLDYHLSHGWEDVTHAIEDSCNCYFYEAGRRTGIEALDEYAQKFGLGEYTGIELPEESKGNMSSPEYKNKTGAGEWYGGDTIQAAIGQSYSIFTPLQLANYVATIANGGTRYRPHIIKSIHRTSDGSVVKTTPKTVEETIMINQDNLKAVRRGMMGVVDEGSASKVFADYNIEIGGKTGTAQGKSTASNTALFVAYAPFDRPEIAVSVVIEHGVRGVNAANVARDIFDAYFNNTAESTKKFATGELMP